MQLLVTKERPKIQNIIAFLKSKGWELKETNQLFNLMYPPKEFQFEEEFKYRIPINEQAVDYEEYILHIVKSMAQLYELDFNDFQHLMSQSFDGLKKEMESLKKEMEIRQSILSFAA